MTRERIFNLIAAGLVAVAFIISLGRIASRTARELDPSIVTIRFAHWQLEAGLRDAFDQVARQYMELHPNVRIEQVTIPERIYPTWLTTQLVGGTAPDLIELGIGLSRDRLPAYFESLGRYVDKPNPYNKGTDLEGVPWRETFVDGLTGSWSYIESLQDFYGVPTTMHTVRMYYNKPLFEKVTGRVEPPASYEEFLEVCKEVKEYAQRTNTVLLPVAGSRYNAPRVMDALFTSQTQRSAQSLEPHNGLKFLEWHAGLALIQGKISLDSPEIRRGLDLMKEVGQYMQPGYLQLGREDATFYFVQQRALMIATGSWDVTSMLVQCPFEIGVFPVPRPSPSHPRYGADILGPPSEAAVGTTGNFGVVRGSPNREQAIDFLQFLTSKMMNRTFSQVSNWLPSVVGVEPADPVKPFRPRLDGYIDGYLLRFGADTVRVFNNNMYRLVGRSGSVDDMLAVLKSDLPAAARSDLGRIIRGVNLNVVRTDTVLGALGFLPDISGSEDSPAQRREGLIELQNYQESIAMWLSLELETH